MPLHAPSVPVHKGVIHVHGKFQNLVHVRWILAIIGEGKSIYLRAPAPPKIWDSGQSIPSDHTVKFLDHTTLAYIQGIIASLLTKLQMDQLTDKERVILDELWENHTYFVHKSFDYSQAAIEWAINVSDNTLDRPTIQVIFIVDSTMRADI